MLTTWVGDIEQEGDRNGVSDRLSDGVIVADTLGDEENDIDCV